MVLLRGRRGFVILLWCVTPVSFDRVRRSSCVNRRPATARSGTCVRDELEWTSGVVRKRAVCHIGSVRSRPPARREGKNQASRAARPLLRHCSPVSYVVRADVCGRFLTRTCFTTAHEELRLDAKGALLRTLQRAGGQENIYTVC